MWFWRWLLGLMLLSTPPLWAQEWRGFAAAEYRAFTETALDADQHDGYGSFVLQPEFYASWDDGRQALTATPFYRWDRYDDRRTHADLRELFWLYVGGAAEWRLGVRKVFWGVTESQHLVDIINQTDLVEDIDGEDKLGQPMASATLLTGAGTFELFVLPYFRERTFPGEEGRLRTLPRVETEEDALYEDRREQRHVDGALRWSDSFGGWDLGVSYFHGTSREPRLVPGVNRRGEAVLFPLYEIISQTGLDLQGAQGAWLWKLEAIRRASERETFWASTAGFEYTLYSVLGSPMDLGGLLEYSHDSRGERATSAFEDDVMLGARLAMNDPASTELLLAAIADRDTSARTYSAEASRRLTGHLRLTLEARWFAATEAGDPLHSFRNDDYVQLGLAYYF